MHLNLFTYSKMFCSVSKMEKKVNSLRLIVRSFVHEDKNKYGN